MSNATDFLMGASSGSARFDNIGDTITGKVVTTEVRQQTDISDGKPLVWDDGSARMQLVVTIQTDQRDDADDDGRRALYVKGSKTAGSRSLHDAVRSAVQAARAKGLEPGGTLTVTFVGEEPSKTRGFNPRKLWQATYVAPDHAAATGDFLGTAPATQPAPPAQPAAKAPETPAEQARKLIAIGMTDAEIAAATGLGADVVGILRGRAA